MNPEVKEKWVAALRSGDYAQTSSTLHRIVSSVGMTPGYCCLGVLCDLAAYEGIGVWSLPSLYGGRRDTVAFCDLDPDATATRFNGFSDVDASSITDRVRAWSGLGTSEVTTLIEMNDSDGSSFDQIAAYIKVEL